MSNVMKRSVPIARASSPAPMTPAAGPERIVRTGSSRASSMPIALPLDCITRKRVPSSASSQILQMRRPSAARRKRSRPWSRAARTRDTRPGCDARPKPGVRAVSSASAIASSLFGFAYEWSRQTAKASASLRRASSAMRASSASVSGCCDRAVEVACAPPTPKRIARATSGVGTRGRRAHTVRCDFAGRFRSDPRSRALVKSATRAPFFSSSALVATVEL